MGMVKQLMTEYCEVIHPDDFDAQDALFLKLMETGQPSLEVIRQVVLNREPPKPRTILETYRLMLADFQKIRKDAGKNIIVEEGRTIDDSITIDDEINRVRTHIRRLEMDQLHGVQDGGKGRNDAREQNQA